MIQRPANIGVGLIGSSLSLAFKTAGGFRDVTRIASSDTGQLLSLFGRAGSERDMLIGNCR